MKSDARQGVFLVIDGLGDLPVDRMGNLTPLEAADTPFLNQMATQGLYGLVDPIAPGEVPNTHSGTGMLFGVLPGETDKIRRGPVEASGAGRQLQAGEIAARLNFATLKAQADGFLVLDRRAGRISSGTGQLAAELADLDLGEGVTACIQPTDQHRGVLVLSGPGLNPSVGDTDPGDIEGHAFVQTCLPQMPGAEKTAQKVNRFIAEAHRRLSEHPLNVERIRNGELPANGVLTRGMGAVFQLENKLIGNGVSVAVVAGCNTILGLAGILGFEAVTDPRFSAAADTNLEAKVEATLAALLRNQLVYLHIKAPDLYAHDQDPEGKRDFLERLDRALGALLEANVIVAVAADHTTDSNTGVHTADPVPALLYDPANPRSDSTPVNFGEAQCRGGNMRRQCSHDFLLGLLDRMGY